MDQCRLVEFQDDFNVTGGEKFGFWKRKFTCLEMDIATDGQWLQNVIDYAKRILPGLNPGQANTSLKRELDTLEIDNLSGMIAELACLRILKNYYGQERILKPPTDHSANQIDIKLENGRTIEVRSSCVRNGITFALFALDKKNPTQQYFDVIGPYSNGYKPQEAEKDYYMRVLYECDKMNFYSLLKKPVLQLYITGGVSNRMMCNPEFYQIKHLVPAGGQVRTESDYRVVPLRKSLDFPQFLRILEMDNGLRPIAQPVLQA